MEEKIKKQPSELRMDLVSNDWIAVATGRARRPESFVKQQLPVEDRGNQDCPFCKPEILNKAILKIGDVISIPNDFPAFFYPGGNNLNERIEGPYKIMDGVGFHEVIITLDHNKHIAQADKAHVRKVIEIYHARYLDLMKNKIVKYISIFHNHGKEAGASLTHPHSQIIAVPVIDPDLKDSVRGAESYFLNNSKCVYCEMIGWDIKDGKRVIYENENFVVLCPFAPQRSFEVRIYPKKHQPYFEKITEEEKDFFADALRVALYKLYKGLNNPPYNFYIHTAPCDEGDYSHYHWHLVILPKLSTWAGFELCAGIEISTIEPEKAAEFLRGIN